MTRRECVSIVAGFCLLLSAGFARADDSARQAENAIAAAEAAVAGAQVSIENGLQFVDAVEGSEFDAQVAEIFVITHAQWTKALKALEGAKQSRVMLAQAKSPEVAKEYALLTTVNANMAISNAKAVQAGLLFVEAAAMNKREAMGLIKQAFHKTLVAASQTEESAKQVKALIKKKYLK